MLENQNSATSDSVNKNPRPSRDLHTLSAKIKSSRKKRWKKYGSWTKLEELKD